MLKVLVFDSGAFAPLINIQPNIHCYLPRNHWITLQNAQGCMQICQVYPCWCSSTQRCHSETDETSNHTSITLRNDCPWGCHCALSHTVSSCLDYTQCELWHEVSREETLGTKAIIHQVTTMLATSKNVLFPGHNHLLTSGAVDVTLWLSPEHQRVGSLVPVVSRWVWPGNRTFLEVAIASMVVTWWIVVFFAQWSSCKFSKCTMTCGVDWQKQG